SLLVNDLLALFLNTPKIDFPGSSPCCETFTGTAHWSEDYLDCGGTKQSPVNVDAAQAIFSPDLRPIQLSGYSLPANKLLKLKNNGHTVVLELPESLALTGGYAQQYRAVQLHLHWGSPSGPGSEHTVNGRRFAAEIHVVHYNTKYDSFTEAMVHPDGLAVLGAFLEVGHGENQYYHEIIKHLPEIQEVGQETLVPGFNIAGLLPANLKFYFHYNGSLTTPPCYQTVKWTIFNQTMLLSHRQVCQGNELLAGSLPASPCNWYRCPVPVICSSCGSQRRDGCHCILTVLLPDVNAGFKPEE
uniref:Carbonic anhydrase n=1 Tax=Malurus cyaneus samueli TaxID=2593467 RepID=A0A8C5U8K7_9PASS